MDHAHGMPPQHVLQCALVLSNTLPYMPEGIHLAVVDPGVGGPTRPLAPRTREGRPARGAAHGRRLPRPPRPRGAGEGRVLVGPDTGLLIPAADVLGGTDAAHELANAEYALDTVS